MPAIAKEVILKKFYLTIFIFLTSITLLRTAEDNNFYNNSKEWKLKVPKIVVEGEVKNTGKVKFRKMRMRTVLVKEALVTPMEKRFIGAYRYEGYSLFDILNQREVKKRNRKEFKLPLDLFVEVYGKDGEKAVISWGEIFYPSDLHRIIIAVRASPIIPSKTDDRWTELKYSKLICGNDLSTVRNIDKPVKIVVRSCPKKFKVDRSADYISSEKFNIYGYGKKIYTFRGFKEPLDIGITPSVFYGRGRGFHGFIDFKGATLKELLGNHFNINNRDIRNSYFVISAIDGYRVVFSYSEIFNRNDGKDVMLLRNGLCEEKGRFSVFVPADFFSDRAVGGINAIELIN